MHATSPGTATAGGESDEGATNSTSATDDDAGEGLSASSSSGEPVANEPPLARADGPYGVDAGSELIVEAFEGLLANDEDPERGALTVIGRRGVSTEHGGLVDIEADGGFVYHPPGWLPFGTDRFDYTTVDEQGATATSDARVVVRAQGGLVALGAMGAKGSRLQGIDADDRAGTFASTAGDINGDGFADALIAAYYGDPGGVHAAGEVYVVFGRDSFPGVMSLAAADVRLDGIDPDDRAGFSVNAGGDVNGDGYSDIAIGAYTADPGGRASAGETYIVFGGEALPPTIDLADADIRLEGVDPADYSGISVRVEGDVNGDGFADIFVGAYLADPNGVTHAGEGYLIYGAPSLPSVIDLADADVRFLGGSIEARTCRYVSLVGDINGDGFSDVMIAGDVDSYLVFGGPTLSNSIELNALSETGEGIIFSGLGGRPDTAGDVDGDGYADILIGRWWESPNGITEAGESYLIYGGPSLPSTIDPTGVDVLFQGYLTSGRSGTEGTTIAGDVNGDGFSDIVIPAAFSSHPVQTGRSYLLLGGPVLPGVISLADADLEFRGIAVGDRMGPNNTSGDIDGDGFADILIGASLASPNGLYLSGESYLLFGDDLAEIVDVLGTEGADTLVAFNGLASDIIIAGRGDDVLVSDGGPDVLRGGEGDDVLVLADDSFFRLDGGFGEDTISLGVPFALDLQQEGSARVRGVERVELSGAGASSVFVSERSVVNLSDTSNMLTIEGDADDTVTLTTGSWSGPIPVGTHSLYSSSATAAQVVVGSTVRVVLR